MQSRVNLGQTSCHTYLTKSSKSRKMQESRTNHSPKTESKVEDKNKAKKNNILINKTNAKVNWLHSIKMCLGNVLISKIVKFTTTRLKNKTRSNIIVFVSSFFNVYR